jgi:hypothetical protein
MASVAAKKLLTITLELPAVTYPRKVYFPEGAHSIVLVHTTNGPLWTLLEDKQTPYLDDAALAAGFGLTQTAYLRSEIYDPAYFDIPVSLCYDYIRLQMRLDMIYDSGLPVYRHLSRLAVLHCQMEAVRNEMSRHIAAKLAAL